MGEKRYARYLSVPRHQTDRRSDPAGAVHREVALPAKTDRGEPPRSKVAIHDRRDERFKELADEFLRRNGSIDFPAGWSRPIRESAEASASNAAAITRSVSAERGSPAKTSIGLDIPP